MVDIDDLWIGERLKVTKSGKIGIFEGVNKNGKIRLKVGDKIFLHDPGNLEIAPEEIVIPELNLDEVISKPVLSVVERTIDLHIEKLNPTLLHALPERIIDFQITSFENHLEQCIAARRYDALVIHGKGSGVLRNAIHSLLSVNKNVRYFHLVNNDGATEVLFQY